MKTTLHRQLKTLTIVLFSFCSSLAFASAFTGTIVVAKGDVKVLNSKLSDASISNKFVLFEGQKFTFDKAKIGMRLKPGQIVMTGTNGKAKVAYQNGDHMMIAPGTSLTLPEPIKGKTGTSSLKLIYGKMRSLISSKGPRNKMNIKTKSAVAGVRGTDFFVSHNPQNGMEVVVLRGEVAVAHEHPDILATEAPKEKLNVVKTGYHAKVKDTFDSHEATKDKLLDVQASSHVELAKEDLKKLNDDQKKKVLTLEKKATKAILADIQHHDPEHFKKLKGKKLSSHEIHTEVVSHLYKQAPQPKKPKKADLETIDQMGKGVYEKYFGE